MNQEKFGNFIKEIRKKNNLTQKQLAEKYNVTYQAVSKWENGKNMPDTSLIKQISEETSLSFTKSGNVYRVTKEGFYSDTPIVVDFEVDGETIVKATLINSNAHEGYEGIANTSVYNKWFGDNLNITFEDIDNFVKSNNKYTNTGSNDLDLITDATYTSNAIVSAYKEVVDAVRGEA